MYADFQRGNYSDNNDSLKESQVGNFDLMNTFLTKSVSNTML